MRIREIQFGDNSQLEALIKTTFLELELPLTGTVYEDVETTQMFESYQDDAAIYLVVEDHGLVKGGAGIKALAGEETSVCELQKMYLAPDMRGKGYGKKLMKVCLEAAKSMGYKQCYLETLSELKVAQNLYKNYGFDEVTRIPFSKKFYIQDRGQDAFDDLIRQWRSEGWDESKGFPDVVLMKWSGTDADRANAGTKVFEPDFEGFGPKEDLGFIPTAEQTPESGVLSAVEGKAGKPDIGRGDTGPARSGGGAYQPHRLRGAAETLRNLTPLQRKNLGLLSIIPPQGR